MPSESSLFTEVLCTRWDGFHYFTTSLVYGCVSLYMFCQWTFLYEGVTLRPQTRSKSQRYFFLCEHKAQIIAERNHVSFFSLLFFCIHLSYPKQVKITRWCDMILFHSNPKKVLSRFCLFNKTKYFIPYSLAK